MCVGNAVKPTGSASGHASVSKTIFQLVRARASRPAALNLPSFRPAVSRRHPSQHRSIDSRVSEKQHSTPHPPSRATAPSFQSLRPPSTPFLSLTDSLRTHFRMRTCTRTQCHTDGNGHVGCSSLRTVGVQSIGLAAHCGDVGSAEEGRRRGEEWVWLWRWMWRWVGGGEVERRWMVGGRVGGREG